MTDELQTKIARLEQHLDAVQRKADCAADFALAALEQNKAQLAALEHAHAQAAELISALKKTSAMNLLLAETVLKQVKG
jgi:hypothetical protein